MKKTITAGVAALALTLTACDTDTVEEPAVTTTQTTTSEETTVETSTEVETTTEADVATTEATSPAAVASGAPTPEDAQANFLLVETITSGLDIYQQPGTDNHFLCITYGEAPGYEFITETGCSEAMSYNGLIDAMMASWDNAFP